jgi:Holliday junction resolvase RusA-like endonuclease
MRSRASRRAWTEAMQPRQLTPEKRAQSPARSRTGLPRTVRSHEVAAAREGAIPVRQVIRIVPVPKPRQSQSDAWRKRPCVLRSRAFCDELALKGARLPPRYRLTFVLPMPRSWSDAEKARMDGCPHTRKPDTSNLVKNVEDALCKRDEELWDIGARKFWGREGAVVIEAVLEPEERFILDPV